MENEPRPARTIPIQELIADYTYTLGGRCTLEVTQGRNRHNEFSSAYLKINLKPGDTIKIIPEKDGTRNASNYVLQINGIEVECLFSAFPKNGIPVEE